MGAEIWAIGFNASIAVFTIVIGGYFIKRVSFLEQRVDELEEKAREQWYYERKLIDGYYRAGLTPPKRSE